jgi:hypothetical protein
MEIPLISKIILYIIIGLFALICILVFRWQIMVLRGKFMKNPDGSVDDWHEQKLFYGIAIADVFLATPVTIAGIIMVFVSPRWGYYILAIVSFWFVWANVMMAATSLRFEKPKISFSWFMVFPFGALVGLAYIVWTLIHFDTIYLP